MCLYMCICVCESNIDIFIFSYYQQSLNLNISSTREVTTVTQGHMQQISSLAFDWTSAHLYWTDQEKGTIEVVSTNGLFRRNLISSNSLVRRPAHLVVDPPHG